MKTERDAVVSKVQSSRLQYDGEKVWSKVDQPLDARICQRVLFAAKNMLMGWGFDRKSLWVDKETQMLKCGEEMVLQTSVHDGAVVVEYGSDWESYIIKDNEEWNTVLVNAKEKMATSRTPTKGLGKGKRPE